MNKLFKAFAPPGLFLAAAVLVPLSVYLPIHLPILWKRNETRPVDERNSFYLIPLFTSSFSFKTELCDTLFYF